MIAVSWSTETIDWIFFVSAFFIFVIMPILGRKENV